MESEIAQAHEIRKRLFRPVNGIGRLTPRALRGDKSGRSYGFLGLGCFEVTRGVDHAYESAADNALAFACGRLFKVPAEIRTGISWRDLPERYGPWQTVYTRFRRYALDGVFTRALQQIQARADAAGDIDWLVQIDSTIVRAHQHAAATGPKGGSTGRTNRTITPSADPEAD